MLHSDNRTDGASTLAKQALQVLLQFARRVCSVTREDASATQQQQQQQLAAVKNFAWHLLQVRGHSMVSIGNAVCSVLAQIAQRSPCDLLGDLECSVKHTACALERSAAAISDHFCDAVPGSGCLLCLSYSGTVLATVATAIAQRDMRVTVCESRPGNEGHSTLA